MNVQTEKIELAKRLLETDDEELLQQIKAIFENYRTVANLPDYVKMGIERSLKQADEGNVTAHDEVMKKYIQYL